LKPPIPSGTSAEARRSFVVGLVYFIRFILAQPRREFGAATEIVRSGALSHRTGMITVLEWAEFISP
jgi:hypothetical protein